MTRLFSLLDLGGDGGEVDENSDFYNPEGIKEGESRGVALNVAVWGDRVGWFD